jgi:hypothetical protein
LLRLQRGDSNLRDRPGSSHRSSPGSDWARLPRLLRHLRIGLLLRVADSIHYASTRVRRKLGNVQHVLGQRSAEEQRLACGLAPLQRKRGIIGDRCLLSADRSCQLSL